jgi:methylmalonyl-CoA/ethylmalonyl-CoA epimerase
MPPNTNALPLPSPSHIGVVVRDMNKTIEFLSSIWGIGPWQFFEYSPSQEDLTVGKPFRQKVAQAKVGAAVLELIEQLEGGGPWPEFLESKGEGLHHIAFTVSNYDEMVTRLEERGAKMIAGGIYQGKRWCYFATEPGGIVVEFGEE